MTYQETVNTIRDAAKAVNKDGLFVHGRASDANLKHDQAFPQIHLYPFTEGDDDENSDSSILMGFWKLDTPNSSEEEREAMIAEMDALSRLFVSRLRVLKTCRIEGKVTREPAYRQLAATASGYIVRFTLISKSPCSDE